MPIDQYSHHFFHVLREFGDDPSGEAMYREASRSHMHADAQPFFDDLPDDFSTLLDIGCGPGYDAAYFAARGKQVTGLTANPTPAQFRFAREHGFLIEEMDMNDLRYADASIDAILCKHVLEHSFSPLASLFEMRRVLKPHGYLFLIVPPHRADMVESGHFTQGWSIGQVIYCLCAAGYNVLNGAFRARPGNVEAVVQPSPTIPQGRGILELKELFPEPIRQIMHAEWYGAFPNRYYTQIAWPFHAPARETVVNTATDATGVSLRTLLKANLRRKGLLGKIAARLIRG